MERYWAVEVRVGEYYLATMIEVRRIFERSEVFGAAFVGSFDDRGEARSAAYVEGLRLVGREALPCYL